MLSNIEQTRTAIKRNGLIAIIRGDFPFEQLLKISDVLYESGISIMEITLNSPGALKAISSLCRQAKGREMLIGAGTVRTSQQVDSALEAGAQFIVSPNFDPESVTQSLAADVPHLPGVFTATEVQNAFIAGCKMVKLFPADALGPAYVKTLRAPLDDVEFVPTGGINAANLSSYVQAGAVAFGIGGSLISGGNQSVEEIKHNARTLVAAWEQANAGQT